ncbi:MAG: glutathione S-transferase C-terminal domain-containing protein, partial [Hyphomicrobium sp.]|nr:glutathione S-transferase C-terminal domain-containing protein [Hyphomicrobium sp.]
LDAQLAGKPFLTGERFTMGDLVAGCYINRWMALPVERPDHANLRAWFERLQQRPAFCKNVMIPLT